MVNDLGLEYIDVVLIIDNLVLIACDLLLKLTIFSDGSTELDLQCFNSVIVALSISIGTSIGCGTLVLDIWRLCVLRLDVLAILGGKAIFLSTKC